MYLYYVPIHLDCKPNTLTPGKGNVRDSGINGIRMIVILNGCNTEYQRRCTLLISFKQCEQV